MIERLRRALGRRSHVEDDAHREDDVQRLEDRTTRAVAAAEQAMNSDVRTAYEAILRGKPRARLAKAK